MVNTSMSLRCFLKGGINSPLIQFSNSSNDTNDNGDGGGMPVFIFWSISAFEISFGTSSDVQTGTKFKEFLSLRSKEDSIIEKLCWSDEIYQGEFDDLSRCNLDCREASESASTKLGGFVSENIKQPNCQPDSDVLQVYDVEAQVIMQCYISKGGKMGGAGVSGNGSKWVWVITCHVGLACKR
ncbi:hypothetical protein HanHA300_Chr05g0189901 [Helianthus annuus]|nr:hypothetical protein HanHA300_Chr05g0189901 [Helianthus annuus]KAJ0748320.1 hypothetical protein HanOQP8_Chr05g0199901 [Helianthus annuus]